MSAKFKWSVAGVIVMFIFSNEILSWAILTAIIIAWGWPIVKEVVTHD